MTSSTFSSRSRLALRSLAAFAALYALYNLGLLLLGSGPGLSRTQWERNVMNAEAVILDGTPDDVIIVGSSLAARIDPTQVGPRVRNLSLNAGSAATGLELVSRRDIAPKLVLVETNFVSPADPEFVEARYRPASLWFKRHLPSARAGYGPVNLWLGVVDDTAFGRDLAQRSITPDPVVFAQILAEQRKTFIDAPETGAARRTLEGVARSVRALEGRGTSVVFFSMPIDPQLSALPKATATRDLYRRAFPEPRYQWLDSLPEGLGLVTVDGLHLAPQSVDECESWLRRQLALRVSQESHR